MGPTSHPFSSILLAVLSLLLHFCMYALLPPRLKQGVCHIVALPFTLKSILRQKEELWKLKYVTMKKYNLQKIL
jgi:hypothetical protein